MAQTGDLYRLGDRLALIAKLQHTSPSRVAGSALAAGPCIDDVVEFRFEGLAIGLEKIEPERLGVSLVEEKLVELLAGHCGDGRLELSDRDAADNDATLALRLDGHDQGVALVVRSRAVL